MYTIIIWAVVFEAQQFNTTSNKLRIESRARRRERKDKQQDVDDDQRRIRGKCDSCLNFFLSLFFLPLNRIIKNLRTPTWTMLSTRFSNPFFSFSFSPFILRISSLTARCSGVVWEIEQMFNSFRNQNKSAQLPGILNCICSAKTATRKKG